MRSLFGQCQNRGCKFFGEASLSWYIVNCELSKLSLRRCVVVKLVDLSVGFGSRLEAKLGSWPGFD